MATTKARARARAKATTPAKTATPEVTATTDKPSSTGRVTRRQAAAEAIKALEGSTTLSELAKSADAIYVAGGGKSNVREAGSDVRRALDTAEAFGIVRLTRPTDLGVEKVQ